MQDDVAVTSAICDRGRMAKAPFYKWLTERKHEVDDAISRMAERISQFMKANPRHSRDEAGIRASGCATEDELKEALDEWQAEVGQRK